MKSQRATLLPLLVLAIALITSPQPLAAAIIVDPNNTGATDVDPDPATWTRYNTAYVGKTASGELLVDNTSQIDSGWSYLGCTAGSTGSVTVSGSDSTWTSSVELYVGHEGNGELKINNGATVTGFYNRIGSSSGSTGTVTVDGTGSTWTSTNCVYIGYEGNGTLNIVGNATVNDSGPHYSYIAYASDSVGTVKVDGTGSKWTDKWGLFIGYGGDGSVDISNGGTVDIDGYTGSLLGYAPSSSGTATIDGVGSKWINRQDFNIGYHGSGSLRITNGGMVTNSNGNIGHGSNSTGTVEVSGIGSIWTNHYALTVGGDGNGSLDITEGGSVSCQSSQIGCSNGLTGVVTVDGTGSTWTSGGRLSIGNGGNGTLKITNGGTVDSNSDSIENSLIGENSGTGIVLVDGSNSTWINDFLYIGHDGSGTVCITDRGTVNNTSGVIGCQASSTGTLKVYGTGSTCTSSTLTIGSSGDGTLDIANGGTVISYFSRIGSSSGSTGIAKITGTNSTWTNNNNLYVGNEGNGTLEITNCGLVSVAGTLTIDFDTDGDGFINMATGGMLALFGDADESLGDFLDLIDGTDAICYWDDSLADWADITGGTLGADYTLEYLTEGDLTGYTLLTVGATPVPGDANGDGMVDGSDVTVLAGNWQVGVDDGQTATWAMGDFNRDGRVDGSDVTILAGNWQYGVSSAATAVPEPGSGALLLMSLVSGLALLRRKRP